MRGVRSAVYRARMIDRYCKDPFWISRVRGPCLPRKTKSDLETPTSPPVSAGGIASRTVSSVSPFKTVKTRMRFSGLRSEEHTSELQSLRHLVCRLLLEKKKKAI